MSVFALPAEVQLVTLGSAVTQHTQSTFHSKFKARQCIKEIAEFQKDKQKNNITYRRLPLLFALLL